MKRLFIISILALTLGGTVHAQETLLEKKVSITMSAEPVQKVLRKLEELGEFRFAYSPETFDISRKVSVDFKEKPVKQVLDKVFEGQGIEYSEMQRKVLIKKKKGAKRGGRAANQQSSMSQQVVDKSQQKSWRIPDSARSLKRSIKVQEPVESKTDTVVTMKQDSSVNASGAGTLNSSNTRQIDFSFDNGSSAISTQKKVRMSTPEPLVQREVEGYEHEKFESPQLRAVQPEVKYESPKFKAFKPKKKREKKEPEEYVKKLRIYGASTTGIARVGDEASIVMGGRGAWRLNRNIGIGLAGYAFETPKGLDDLLSLTDFRHSGGYGGFLFEFTPSPEKAVHVSFPLVIAGGATAYSRKPLLQDKVVEDSKAMFVLEPGVELEFNVIKYVRVSFGVNYRYTTNTQLQYRDNQEQILSKTGLNGLTGACSIKFGIF